MYWLIQKELYSWSVGDNHDQSQRRLKRVHRPPAHLRETGLIKVRPSSLIRIIGTAGGEKTVLLDRYWLKYFGYLIHIFSNSIVFIMPTKRILVLLIL